MRDEQGEGRGRPKVREPKQAETGSGSTVEGAAGAVSDKVENLEIVLDRASSKQIEYLLFQSTQGLHFLFHSPDIVRVMGNVRENQSFFTEEKMTKVQELLSSLLGCASIQEKQSFLERLHPSDFELVVRSYFQLVDNTILAQTDVRH